MNLHSGRIYNHDDDNRIFQEPKTYWIFQEPHFMPGANSTVRVEEKDAVNYIKNKILKERGISLDYETALDYFIVNYWAWREKQPAENTGIGETNFSQGDR